MRGAAAWMTATAAGVPATTARVATTAAATTGSRGKRRARAGCGQQQADRCGACGHSQFFAQS
jgi:hypothetical protein